MENTATRLIALIMLLQSAPNQKAGDLAGKLGVSPRTLHRYIGMLDDMGIPVYSERGRGGGFSLVRGYKMPPLVLSPEESVAVYLGTGLVKELWGGLYGASAEAAMAKVDAVLPDLQREEAAWARRTLVTSGLYRGEAGKLQPVLERLKTAIRQQRLVRIRYRGQNSRKATQRRVSPYVILHRRGWCYLIGYCHLRRDLRNFRVDRIDDLTVLEQTFTPDPDFHVDEYLAAEFTDQMSALLRFAPEADAIVRDISFICDREQVLPDGSIEVRMAMPDLHWAASMVLSFGPLVVVVEPQSLRDLVRQWAGATAALYSDS